jgi:diguanylate cyclase (GGDEF)-like protein
MKEKSGSWRWILSRGKVVEANRDGTAARLVGVHSDVSDLKRAEADLVYLAYHDQLTGLLNRKAFYERADLSLSLADRSDPPQLRAFLLIDLDNFKDVNDGFGHEFGDRLLKLAAARLSDSLRQTDLLFRLGGDEFTIILTSIAREVDAAVVASKLLRAFAAPFMLDGQAVYTGLSIGISLFPRDGVDTHDLIRKADTALYDSKRDRNTYRYYTLQMQAEAVSRMQTVSNLRRALEQNELTLHYQPIVDGGGTIRGAEALLRWNCPDEGLKMPGEFIETAEETGVILDIGRWVLRRATRDAQFWRERGLGDLRLSVNLSPRQLRDRSIIGDISSALADSGFPPELLTIELTENSFVDLSDESTERLDAIRALGTQLAIDDFGTGYSSMSYLKRLPVDAIKIDRSFVIGLPMNASDVSIVEAVLTMAHGLGLTVVAEGVDDDEQLAFLSSRQCDSFQGFYFSKGVAGEQFQELAGNTERTSHSSTGAM